MEIPTFSGSFSALDVATAIDQFGGAVLSGVVPGPLLDTVIEEFDAFYPPWQDYAERLVRAGRDPRTLVADSDELQRVGPFGSPALDAIPLLDTVLSVVATVLGDSALLLQSHLWAKTAGSPRTSRCRCTPIT